MIAPVTALHSTTAHLTPTIALSFKTANNFLVSKLGKGIKIVGIFQQFLQPGVLLVDKLQYGLLWRYFKLTSGICSYFIIV